MSAKNESGIFLLTHLIRDIPALLDDILEVNSSSLSYGRVGRRISGHNAKDRHGMTRFSLLFVKLTFGYGNWEKEYNN